MNLLAPVSTIMSTDLVTIGPDDTMQEVEGIFNRYKIHHLPVVSDKKLVGILSKSDYLFFKRGFNDQTTDARLDLFRLKVWKVGDVMTKGLAKMESHERINVALEVFSKNLFHAILITEEDDLVGIVTTLDIIHHLIQDKGAINKYES